MEQQTLRRYAKPFRPLPDPQMERFAVLLAQGYAVREAYRKVTGEDKPHQAYAWNNDPKVQKRVLEIQERAFESAALSVDRVLQEIARVAFGSITDVVEWDEHGNVWIKPSRQLTPDQAATIQEVYKTGEFVRVKQHGKIEALKLLARCFGLDGDAEMGDSAHKRIEELHRRRLENKPVPKITEVEEGEKADVVELPRARLKVK